MRENAPFLGERLGAVERGAVDEAVKKEGIVGGRRVGLVPISSPQALGLTR
jgi:hypothetical protein